MKSLHTLCCYFVIYPLMHFILGYSVAKTPTTSFQTAVQVLQRFQFRYFWNLCHQQHWKSLLLPLILFRFEIPTVNGYIYAKLQTLTLFEGKTNFSSYGANFEGFYLWVPWTTRCYFSGWLNKWNKTTKTPLCRYTWIHTRYRCVLKKNNTNFGPVRLPCSCGLYHYFCVILVSAKWWRVKPSYFLFGGILIVAMQMMLTNRRPPKLTLVVRRDIWSSRATVKISSWALITISWFYP